MSASPDALNARWRAFQLMLSDQLKSLPSPDGIVEAATRLLAEYLGASHCWYTEVGADMATYFVRGGWRAAGIAGLPASGRIADFGPDVAGTLGMGRDFIVDDVDRDPRTGAFAQSYRAIMIGSLLAAPIFKGGHWAANLNIAKPDAYHWSEEDILVARDVAERTWSAVENAIAQAALRQERDRSRYIFDTLSEGLVLLTADNTLSYVNDAAARLNGAARDTLVGMRYELAFPWAGGDLDVLYRRVRASGKPASAEHCCTLPSGRTAWLNLKITPSLEDGLAIFFDDVTERKQAALATQKAEAHKTMLLELGDRLRGVADDPEAMMRVATEELARLLDVPRVGYVSMDDAGEYCVVGHNYNDARRVPALPARIERLDDYGLELAADIRAGRMMRVDDLATDPRTCGAAAEAHAAIGARASIAAPIQRNGKTVAFMFAHDDRPRAWSDDDLELMRQTAARTWDAVSRARAALALCEADRRKDEFLAMLAHELRNPLAPISSAAELLRLAQLDEARVRQTSSIISRQVKHMTGLIDDLLDVSRVTRGLVSLDPRELDVRTVVAEAVEQVRPLIELRRHRLAVHVTPEPAPVWGDLKRLVQCVANVLNNAAKYTPEGGNITLHLRSQGRQTVISIADDGIGMTPDVVAHAFELFAQAERTADRSQGGLGIGLALVKSLVELHGGTVALRSPGPGRGSEFTIGLPRLDVSVPGAATAQAGLPVPDAQRASRILIVDDNVDAAQVLSMLCEMLGHAVSVEHASLPALERALLERPDVCLVDIGLPDMDGKALARRLRSHPETAGATLVAVTGYGQEKDRAAALAAGFDHYLVKPVELAAIEQVLGAQARARRD
jgi:PAS domain S-box-containing protein